MKIKELIDNFIKNNKSQIEIFQNSVIQSLASLIYSEYIKNIKQQRVPIQITWVPQINFVRELIDNKSDLVKTISNSLIDLLTKKDLFKKYQSENLDVFNLFTDEENKMELMSYVLNLYIMPNAYYCIPNTICKKFDLLNTDNKTNNFRESVDLDLFNRAPITDKQFDYIVEEILLNIILSIPSVKKKKQFPADNTEIFLVDDEILTIDHENAICPIHINENIIKNNEVFPLLSFVTNTNISDHNYQVSSMFKNEKMVMYDIKSNPFNKITITELL